MSVLYELFFTTQNFTSCKVNTKFSKKIESIIHSKINNLIIFIPIPLLEYLKKNAILLVITK